MKMNQLTPKKAKVFTHGSDMTKYDGTREQHQVLLDLSPRAHRHLNRENMNNDIMTMVKTLLVCLGLCRATEKLH